jgi:predicted acyl esterase
MAGWATTGFTMAHSASKVPIMIVHSLWDQEDIYGAIAVYKAIEPRDTNNDRVFLVIGPWHHGQEIEEGSSLGAIKLVITKRQNRKSFTSPAMRASLSSRWWRQLQRHLHNEGEEVTASHACHDR